MIRRFAVTAALGAAAAAALVASPALVAGAPDVTLAAMSVPSDDHGPHHPGPPGHGPDWDHRGGPWDGRGGPGHGGGWDGNGGGWDGHRWWVSPHRCDAGHGHVERTHDRWRHFYCEGGRFNGLPVHF